MFEPKDINKMTLEELKAEIKKWAQSSRFRGRYRILLIQRRIKELTNQGGRIQ